MKHSFYLLLFPSSLPNVGRKNWEKSVYALDKVREN